MSERRDRDASGRAVLLNLWEHHWWSLERILSAAKDLSAEELARDLRISYGSFHGALAHLVGAEMVWLARVLRGESLARVPGAAELPSLDAAEREWRGCVEGWRKVFVGEDLQRVIRYRNTKGTEFGDPLWLVLAHLADHNAAYRGTLITALRLLGRTPPETGLIFYARQKGKG